MPKTRAALVDALQAADGNLEEIRTLLSSALSIQRDLATRTSCNGSLTAERTAYRELVEQLGFEYRNALETYRQAILREFLP